MNAADFKLQTLHFTPATNSSQSMADVRRAGGGALNSERLVHHLPHIEILDAGRRTTDERYGRIHPAAWVNQTAAARERQGFLGPATARPSS